MAAGEPASGDRARVVAERHRQQISRWFYPCSLEMHQNHRQQISRWFYPCSLEMHRGLGEMYVADERFARHYEQVAAGLAAYVRDAITANAQVRASLSL